MAEAKNRLRNTAEQSLPSGYVRRHPVAVLAVAFAAGYILARNPLARGLLSRAVLGVL